MMMMTMTTMTITIVHLNGIVRIAPEAPWFLVNGCPDEMGFQLTLKEFQGRLWSDKQR